MNDNCSVLFSLTSYHLTFKGLLIAGERKLTPTAVRRLMVSFNAHYEAIGASSGLRLFEDSAAFYLA
jgi:hypothetical protein